MPSRGYTCCHCRRGFRGRALYHVPEDFSVDRRLSARTLCEGCGPRSPSAVRAGDSDPRPSRGGRGTGFLDRSVIARISVGDKVDKIYHPGDGSHGEAWAYTYLVACLATFLGFDEARQVVLMVKYAGERA